MSSKRIALAELAAPIRNAIVGGPFGSNLVSSDYVTDGVPVIRGQNMGDRWVIGPFAFVSPEKAATLRQNLARPGDLVFTQRGTLGQVALVPKQPFPEYVVSQSQMKITVDPAKADVGFLYYLFRTPEQRQYIFNSAIQTGVPHTNLGILKATPIDLPPMSKQVEIAAICGALDDRIELLRETNATLEAIARTSFKSWFVDFEPVRAKSNGRAPAGMDEATAALFPHTFEAASSGEIPAGWTAGTVGNFAQLQRGSVSPSAEPAVEFEHFSLPAFDDGEEPIRELGEAIKSNKSPVPASSVLLSKLNPHIPRVWLPVQPGLRAVCSTEFLVFSPSASASSEFLYCCFAAPEFSARLCQLVTGTSNSHQRVKPDGVLKLPAAVPPAPVMAAFTDVVRPILGRVGHNRRQARLLANLRDTLLPRLISGQLRLPEAITEVETA